MLCLVGMAIFSLIMIENLLPSRISEARARIRETVVRIYEGQGSGRSWPRPASERAEIGQWLSRLEPLSESFKPGQKKSAELLWLAEELAAGFPKTTLEAAVWWALIVPVLKKAGLDRELSEQPGAGRTWPDGLSLAYNHLFLPLPASRTLKLLETWLAERRGVNDQRGRYFLVFDLPASKRILVPATIRPENRPAAGVVYYLVVDEGLNLESCPAGQSAFPFRPAVCRKNSEKVLSRQVEPILSLTAERFQAGLETYYLLLSAVFSGWARAGWQGLVRKKQSGHFSPDLDTEISFLATEIGRLQHGLFHLSQSRSIPADCHSRKVEKLCLLGLHLASRAWRHWPARAR